MTHMTQEILWLTLTLMLAASLWVPYITAGNLHPQTDVDDLALPPPLTGFPNWVHRAHRAHLNIIQMLAPFAGLVLIAISWGSRPASRSWPRPRSYGCVWPMPRA